MFTRGEFELLRKRRSAREQEYKLISLQEENACASMRRTRVSAREEKALCAQEENARVSKSRKALAHERRILVRAGRIYFGSRRSLENSLTTCVLTRLSRAMI